MSTSDPPRHPGSMTEPCATPWASLACKGDVEESTRLGHGHTDSEDLNETGDDDDDSDDDKGGIDAVAEHLDDHDDDLRIVALPHLSEDILLDEDALDLVLAEVVEVSSAAHRVQAEADRIQSELQDVLEPVLYAAVLRLAQLYQAKLVVLLPIVAAWSWSECRQEAVL